MSKFYETITKEDVKVYKYKDKLVIYFKRCNIPYMRLYYIIKKKFEARPRIPPFLEYKIKSYI